MLSSSITINVRCGTPWDKGDIALSLLERRIHLFGLQGSYSFTSLKNNKDDTHLLNIFATPISVGCSLHHTQLLAHKVQHYIYRAFAENSTICYKRSLLSGSCAKYQF